MIKYYHSSLEQIYKILGDDLPKNKNSKSDPHQDMLLRELDCAVIEYMHQSIYENWKKEILESGISKTKNFDATRGVFTEGGKAFEGAGLFEKSHIQICVRNPNCIKGFFIPRQDVDFPKM